MLCIYIYIERKKERKKESGKENFRTTEYYVTIVNVNENRCRKFIHWTFYAM